MPIVRVEHTYQAIQKWITEERETLRDELENPKLTELQTAIKRGHLARLKKLRQLLEENSHV